MWCACGQSERTTSCKGKIPGQREITQPGGRSYLCKCDLAGYEMEICLRAPISNKLRSLPHPDIWASKTQLLYNQTTMT